ncbi:MAG: Unknown protein [uncultured Aureispira sp.]|uniref:Peptidoglycan peptidase n=1 Tax=uncultured Aureispira sp. TaxID=1331704 RepID=A0A6S6SIK4_9BACT|nr:MAG: Unknown protein [uncultured Aureispira sp.]
MKKLKELACSIVFTLFLLTSCTSVESNSIAPDASSTSKDSKEATAPTFQNGDIIFQTSNSSQSKAIQLATHSPYSHVGIIYEQKGAFWVYEAIEPVKLTPLKTWIKRGKKGHYVVKRLKNASKVLSSTALKKMKTAGEQYKGKHYDLYFEWSDDKIYCSELVWKIYKEALDIELGTLQQLESFDLSNPIVKNKLQERYKGKIPLDEKVISPADIFESSQLIEVDIPLKN